MQRLPTATIRCICRLHHSAVVPSACCVSAPQHRTAERLFVRLFVRLFFRLLVVFGLSWKGPLESLWDLWDVWSFSYSAGQAGGVLVTSNLWPLDSMPPFDAAAVSCGLLRAVQTSKLCSKSLPRWGDLLQDIPKELITYQRESHMFSPEYNKYERVGKGKTPYHGRFDMYSQQSLTDLQWLVKNPKRQSVLLFYHIFDGHLLSLAHNCWTQEVLVSTRSGSKMDHELPGHSWSFLVSIHGFHNCGAAYLVQRCAA